MNETVSVWVLILTMWTAEGGEDVEGEIHLAGVKVLPDPTVEKRRPRAATRGTCEGGNDAAMIGVSHQ